MQNGCEVEWELMSLYGTALDDTLSVYHFAMSSDVKYEPLSPLQVSSSCASRNSFQSLLHPPSCVVSNRTTHAKYLMLSASSVVLQIFLGHHATTVVPYYIFIYFGLCNYIMLSNRVLF